jgi:hypothetical protein
VVWPHSFRVPEGADIVINATSIGLYPEIDGRLDLDVNSLQNRKEQPNCALLNPPNLPESRCDADCRDGRARVAPLADCPMILLKERHSSRERATSARC